MLTNGVIYKGAFILNADANDQDQYAAMKAELDHNNYVRTKQEFQRSIKASKTTAIELDLLKVPTKSPTVAILKEMEEAFQYLSTRDYQMTTKDDGGMYVDDPAMGKNIVDIIHNAETFYAGLIFLRDFKESVEANMILNILGWTDKAANRLATHLKTGGKTTADTAKLAADIMNLFQHRKTSIHTQMGFVAEDVTRLLASNSDIQEEIKKKYVEEPIAKMLNKSNKVIRFGQGATAFKATLRANYHADTKIYSGGGKPLSDVSIQPTAGGANVTIKTPPVNISVKHHKNTISEVKLAEIAYSKMYLAPRIGPFMRTYLYRAIMADSEFRTGYSYYLAEHFFDQITKDYGNPDAATEYIVDNYKLMRMDDYLFARSKELRTEFKTKNLSSNWWSKAEAKDNIDALHQTKLMLFAGSR